MPQKLLLTRRGAVLLVVASFLLLPLLHVLQDEAAAAITSCSASVAPQVIGVNKTENLVFTVNNTDSSAVTWVRVTAPTSDFQIFSGSATGWARTLDSSTVITFHSGSLAAGNSLGFTVGVQTGTNEIAKTDWTVETSDDSGGSNPFTCSGDTGVAIQSDTAAPNISNIAVTNVTATQATVSWTTNENATSVVEYGPTISYGLIKEDGALTTSHSLTLTALTAETTYHFRVKSVDGSSNSAQSSDQTFTTTAPADTTAPTISDLTVKNVTTSSATIMWSTNEAATSVVKYGKTTSYGSTVSDTSQVTSHSVQLTGLEANTTYHYQISSADAAGNNAQSADNTFSTAASSTSQAPTTVAASPTPSPVTAAAPTPAASALPAPAPIIFEAQPPPDTTPPQVVITTDLSRPFTEAPAIEGVATDNERILRVEYSTDEGRNWLPAQVTETEGVINFQFTPAGLLDGNHPILVRAVDTSDNIGLSERTLIIDRLPPKVGALVYALGAQIVQPDSRGTMHVLSGFDQRITISAVGGPTTIDLIAQRVGALGSDGALTAVQDREPQVFSLVKSNETGLWSGTVSFERPGLYRLTSRAIDGANNVSWRVLESVVVLPAGRVLEGSKPVDGAVVSVFTFNEIQSTFVPWQSEPFGQRNPQETDATGQYQLVLPPGRYYLAVEAPGKPRLRTEIFGLEQSRTINMDFDIASTPHLSLGPWQLALPSLLAPPLPLTLPAFVVPVGVSDESPAASSPLPFFALEQEGGLVYSSEFAGRPYVLTFLTSWSPLAHEQLVILDEVAAADPQLGVRAVFIQETSARTSVIREQGGYELALLTDPVGEVAELLHVQHVPTHFFIDRHGVVREVRVEVLNVDEIRDTVLRD